MSASIRHLPTGTVLDRRMVVERMVHALADHEWAFQGADGAVARWIDDDGMGDLDVWVSDASARAAADLLRTLGGVALSTTDRGARLRHLQFWVPTVRGARIGAIVDLTVGDLRVGPVLLVPQHAITTETRMVLLERRGDADEILDGAHRLPARVLSGAARVADLALRPLLRGRVVDGLRFDDAVRTAGWLHREQRAVLQQAIARCVGTRWSTDVELWLGRSPVAPDAARMSDVRTAARRRLALASAAPRAAWATFRQRSIVLPTRRPGPAGMRSRGVVVALVGTDGSGKSTTAVRLGTLLAESGFTVRDEYFGMARGNLPGLGLIRKLAGGGDTSSRPTADDIAQDASTAGRAPSILHRAASWAYVLDYSWRYLRRVRPAVRRGEAVICDRWVSDLRRHPVPDSPAARLAEWLVGAPDAFVLNDAPPAEIVARKAERTLEAATAEQAALRAVGRVLDGRRTRRGGPCRFLTVNTSSKGPGTPDQRIMPVVQALMAAAHDGLPHDWVPSPEN